MYGRSEWSRLTQRPPPALALMDGHKGQELKVLLSQVKARSLPSLLVLPFPGLRLTPQFADTVRISGPLVA